MLLEGDGHRVRVLERDSGSPPGEPDEAWFGWERRGVNQFRMIHYFLPRFRKELHAALPDVEAAIEAAGALRNNLVAGAPAEISGGPREGDDDFESLTGRRPVVEAAIAGVAEGRPGVEVLRGTAVASLLTGASAIDGVPHVVGVRLEDGRELTADLVVDAGGRRSALPRWLEAIGARPCAEELDDCGFIYYGRHFRSPDGTLPPAMGPLLSHHGSVSILTLPADNGTWGVGFVTVADDAAMRGLRRADRWDAALRSYPLVAHWADGEPLDDDVAVMAKIEDRIRETVVDGVPVATGVATIGDAWACTNPSVGRGASIGLLHALALRDLLRSSPSLLGDPGGFALAWHDRTKSSIEPWYRATLHFDRNRLNEAKAAIDGRPYEPDDVVWAFTKALEGGAMLDPDVFRGYVSVAGLLRSGEELFGEPGFAEKVLEVGAGWRDQPDFGPTRDELVKIVNA
jgi:2-polyprenyl-6-methoxyphenol hydroxylase-like FAD-dependent oxidoreductase